GERRVRPHDPRGRWPRRLHCARASRDLCARGRRARQRARARRRAPACNVGVGRRARLRAGAAAGRRRARDHRQPRTARVSLAAARPGAVEFARCWGISLASFVGGLLTLFVFRRGLPRVGLIVGYLLLMWLLVAILVQARDTLAASERRTHRFVLTATEYAVQ